MVPNFMGTGPLQGGKVVVAEYSTAIKGSTITLGTTIASITMNVS